jgi:hypothetical protein
MHVKPTSMTPERLELEKEILKKVEEDRYIP